MDFIRLLLISNSFNYILIVINQFIKIVYFISITIDIITSKVTKLFIDNIYRLYGILKSIISNRDI